MTTSPAPTDTTLNDIAAATAAAVAEDSGNAQVVFRAAAVPRGRVASSITARSHTLQVDEPPTLGGDDAAANPVEVYLAALLSCQVVTYRFWAQRLGITVDELSLTAEGDLDVCGFFGLDESVRPGFQQVRVRVRVRGPETDERYAELQRAVEAHCPVLDLTTGTTPVHSTLEITR
ncbi:OsmC family protein [Nocardia cyriacigeorgica]|uniref:OsmC family protein n=1 Tax=Nocardia cyriacigeorgica TaxID=135487 RepID=UPI001895774F|nr:OsmC family protein [Nocardia cyriacigeorgica]MBF6344844.1 OsmC family protein [Nocardia cyriacigeorgica]